MATAQLREGIERWPIEKWTNGHENFTHRFQKNASFRLLLPNSVQTSTEKYRATTLNFMWLIDYAIRNNIQMRALGNGWSFSEVAVCDGGIVDTKALRLSFAFRNSFLAPAYLAAGKQPADLFFVQCGMSMLQVNEKLQEVGRSLKASGASNGQSVAGATATGTHGAAFNVGAVHDTILGLHIITGPDKHVWLEKASNPIASDAFITWLGAERVNTDNDDMFNAAVVSFGSFGFIHGIMLQTEPLYLLEEHRTGELTYDTFTKQAMNKMDFTGVADKLPYPANTPGKEFYHFEVLANPHDFEPGNPDKGIYLKSMYKTPYRTDYPKRQRDTKGFTYGDNTLGLIQTILDTLGPTLSAPLIPRLVNTLLPLVFKPAPPQFGTLNETFANTKFRGKAASAAIGLQAADASRVLEEIVAINKQSAFPGVVAFRYVKGTKALLGFTRYPLTCVLELDGVDAKASKDFFVAVWNRLEFLKIPYTLHWGKINFILNTERVRNMYGSATVDKWIACRHRLLDEPCRKVFTNAFLQQAGLAG